MTYTIQSHQFTDIAFVHSGPGLPAQERCAFSWEPEVEQLRHRQPLGAQADGLWGRLSGRGGGEHSHGRRLRHRRI